VHGKQANNITVLPRNESAESAAAAEDELLVHPVQSHVFILRTANQVRNNLELEIENGESDSASTKSSGHGHSNSKGMLNMHGIFLHVLGDALGSIGVIVSGLIIWLATEWKTRFIVDPIISIFITTMIVFFTIPLIKSASFILLQGVPHHIPLEKVREELLRIPGVFSVHDLHIWQLSDTKLVASVHIQVSRTYDTMQAQAMVQRIMHSYGVHSSTVQPELIRSQLPNNDTLAGESSCLLQCVDTACAKERCCSDTVTGIKTRQPMISSADYGASGEGSAKLDNNRAILEIV